MREDYSADGKAWAVLSRTSTRRSRAYRWNEDGLAGICDLDQRMCFALAFWNGRDPFLKERIFGLSGPEGNHGEDAKEYWWYVDATPTASWLRWRYHYPQAEFPYARLREENARRGKQRPRVRARRHRHLRRGTATGRSPPTTRRRRRDDVCLRIRVRNAGPEAAELHVLPTLWFRNRWSWEAGTTRPAIRADAGEQAARARRGGRARPLAARSAACDPAGASAAAPVLRERDQRRAPLRRAARGRRTRRTASTTTSSRGAATVNPARQGTKMACWYRLAVAPGDTVELRLRLARDDAGERARPRRGLRTDARRPRARGRRVLRDAAAGERDRRRGRGHAPGVRGNGLEPAVLPLRRRAAGSTAIRPSRRRPRRGRRGRNAGWRHLNNHDVIAMPDKWEYPWYAVVGPRVPLRRARAHRPGRGEASAAAARAASGTCTRTASCPPTSGISATSTRRCTPGRRSRCSGSTAAPTSSFLARVFHKLLINFTWWVNRKDALGDNIFEGGFLGPRQHRPVRPLGDAPRRRRARAVRRHGVDGEVLPQHARDGAAAGRTTTAPTRTWR